jgi:hypothetical protein
MLSPPRALGKRRACREARPARGSRVVNTAVSLSLAALAAALSAAAARAQPSEADECAPIAVETRRIAGVRVERVANEPATVEFESGLAIDADGAPRAYHPDDSGLDRLAHAGEPGNWWALATGDGTPQGVPLVQGPGDPAPGYHVSTTSLYDGSRPASDPRRYVDSEQVPYVALPAPFVEALGCALGDLAWVERTALDGSVHRSAAIFADVSPPGAPLGEGSMLLAQRLGVPSDPRHGGTFRVSVRYAVFPGSGSGWPRTVASIDAEGERLERARRARDAASCPR